MWITNHKSYFESFFEYREETEMGKRKQEVRKEGAQKKDAEQAAGRPWAEPKEPEFPQKIEVAPLRPSARRGVLPDDG